MTQTKQLLAVRSKSNARKPAFVVKESRFVKRIKLRWRNMHGRHSKVRQMHSGRPARPTPGYGAPAAVRGLHQSGLTPVIVATPAQLVAIKPAHEGAVLAAKLGAKKRLALVTLAQQKNIALLNIKNPTSLIEKIKSMVSTRHSARTVRTSKKSRQEQENRRRAEEKKTSSEEKKQTAKAKKAQQSSSDVAEQ
ncbi:hypothetical protein HYV86_05115 [Candidatus Woesearchaeota archaeon]|nr:hypothetical protein [Candidatus Woesearchaeota archaeon]